MERRSDPNYFHGDLVIYFILILLISIFFVRNSDIVGLLGLSPPGSSAGGDADEVQQGWMHLI